MTYSEDLREEVLNGAEVRRVIDQHSLSFEEFRSETGLYGPDYDGDAVASWLGY